MTQREYGQGVTIGRLLALAFAAAACSSPQVEPLWLQVTVRDPLQAPVPGASFWLDGRELGQSDAQGELRVSIPRVQTRAPTLRHACPVGHRTDAASRQLPWRGLSTTELRLSVTCQPISQPTPLVVIAHAPEATPLPVLVDGLPTTVTSHDGVAHSLLALRPGQSVEVSLDTRGQPGLRPRNPARRFVTGSTPEVLLFVQTLERERATRRVQRPSAPRRLPTLPYHIR